MFASLDVSLRASRCARASSSSSLASSSSASLSLFVGGRWRVV